MGLQGGEGQVEVPGPPGGPLADPHRPGLLAGLGVPEAQAVGAGGNLVEGDARPPVQHLGMGRGHHPQEGVHLVVDIAVELHQAGPDDLDPGRVPGLVLARVEAVALGHAEHVVQDVVQVREGHLGPGRGEGDAGLELLAQGPDGQGPRRPGQRPGAVDGLQDGHAILEGGADRPILLPEPHGALESAGRQGEGQGQDRQAVRGDSNHAGVPE